MTGNVFGFLLATYYLIGRWSMDRLDGAAGATSIIEEPRCWIVVSLIPVILLLRPRKTRQRLQAGSYSFDAATCLFLTYMLFTSLWAPSAELAYDKAQEVLLLLIVTVLIAASRSALAHEQIEQGFWWAMVAVGATMASVAIFYSTGGRIHVPGGGPNSFGRNMGLMGLGAAYLAIKYGREARPVCAVAIIVAMLMVLLCGSRGALLSFGMGTVVLFFTAREALAKKMTAAAAVALLGAALILSTRTGQNALDTFQSRIVETTLEKQHLSGREELWLDAVDWIHERPWFGWGLNAYRAKSWVYPHNIFLEVTMEGGIVGLALLLATAWIWWRHLRRCPSGVSRVALAGLALTFTAAQTSGDLFDSRGVFLMLALATPMHPSASTSFRTRPGARRSNSRHAAIRNRVAPLVPSR
jgi:O-antigen ligase